MTDKQPVALALAAFLEQFRSFPDDLAAAAELRRLHAENEAKDALLRQALEALEQLQGGCTDHNDGTVEAITVWCPEVIDALRAALAEQPAGSDAEPVAWRWLYNGSPDSEKCFPMPGPDADVIAKAGASTFPRTVQYLYTAPQPAKQPLTREELFELAEPFGEFQYGDAQGHKRIDFANAIIAAYERKNGVQT